MRTTRTMTEKELFEKYADKLEVFSCCTSCHEDADSLGYDLCEFVAPDGSRHQVCCSVYGEIKRFDQEAI